MKRILYFIFTILEICFLIGAYLFNYYTINKLGMVRWVNSHCIKWEKNYPITMIKGAVIVLLIALFLMLLYQYMKQRKDVKKLVTVMVAVTAILFIGSLGYMLIYSFTVKRAYYFVSIMLVVATFIQETKTLIGIKTCKKNKE